MQCTGVLRHIIHTNIAPSSSSRINGYNDTTLVPERERGRPVLDLDLARRVCVIVCVQPEEGSGLPDPAIPSVETSRKSLARLTSGTEGTANLGTPFTKLPIPLWEPHTNSETSSSSPIISFALRSSAAAPVVEKRLAKEFIVVVNSAVR